MKKLTIVYHYFAHYREPVLRELCQSLSADFELELLADEVAEIPALKTIPLRTFCSGLCSYSKLKNRWLGPWLWQSGLLRAIWHNNADVVIFLGQFNFLSTWLAVVLARMMGKKTYFWSHGVYGNEGRFKKWVRISFYKLSHGMLLYGNHAKDLLIEAGMPAERLHVIYNSLDYKRQKLLREQKKESIVPGIRLELFGSDSPYIIFVGRLTAVKRLDLLFSALSVVNQKANTDIRCLIVGDGPERLTLQQLVESEGWQKSVKFYGACHDEVVLSDLLYASNLCVAPGNVGLTAIHSLVYGTPVITHGNKSWQGPEFEAIIPSQNGDFFEQGSVSDLVLKVCDWIKLSEANRAKVRSSCYKIVDEKYNPEYQAKVIAWAIDGKGC